MEDDVKKAFHTLYLELFNEIEVHGNPDNEIDFRLRQLILDPFKKALKSIDQDREY